MTEKVLKEFGCAMQTSYPNPEYPQDLIDGFIMPGLRRSYDKARRDDWKFAKATTSEFEFKTGPMYPLYKHVNDEPCEIQFNDEAVCPWCEAGIAQMIDCYIHQFGWYVAVEMEEEVEDDAISQK